MYFTCIYKCIQYLIEVIEKDPTYYFLDDKDSASINVSFICILHKASVFILMLDDL